MTELVLRTDTGGVAELTLNRPESLNALSPALFMELRTHLEAIAETPETIGCVILAGKGRSFSAGNDLKAIGSGDRAPSPHYQAETLDFMEQMPQPIIVAVQGHCYTGALEVALAGDLMMVAESAKIADTHGKWAMVPTWGMTQRLPRRVGLVRAREMMYTGRVVSGTEAVTIGLANHCVPDDELMARTHALAADIVKNSWHTLRSEKTLLRDGQQTGLADGLRHERDANPGPGPDMQERLGGF